MPVEYHQTALSFEISYDLRYAVLRRNTDEHMHVVSAQLRFDDFDSFLLALLSQFLPNIYLDFSVYRHSPIFRREYYVVLTSPCRMI